MSRIPLIILLVLCVCTVSVAQSKKKQKKTKSSQQQSSSLSPYFPSEDYQPEKKGKSKKSLKATHNAMAEHESRMRAVVKDRNRAEKEMSKPQYSDPSYFGHKRKPKKHRAGKLKFCKECEIRH